jgi:hypothetical protein
MRPWLLTCTKYQMPRASHGKTVMRPGPYSALAFKPPAPRWMRNSPNPNRMGASPSQMVRGKKIGSA